MDRCPLDGKEAPTELWGAACPEHGDRAMVHIGHCSICEDEIGYVIDDDYQSPEVLVCSSCISGKKK